MPELPEVQTIVDDLNRKIKGDIITDFWSDAPKNIKNISVEQFKKGVVGKKIIIAHRIGKNMFIDLSDGKTIYIHLKMTGHLLVKLQNTKDKYQKNSKNQKSKSKTDYFEDKVNQYIHHIWYLGKNKNLEFSDLRKFAKIVLLDTKDIRNYKDITTLGVDALSPDFTQAKFKEILARRPKAPVGIVLMDQNLIAGIGNIYRSEILYAAGVMPTRLAKDLTGSEIKEIYKQIGIILKKAIKLRGTSDSDYRDTDGAPGNFHKVLKVYRREKKTCQKCGTIVKRMKMGGRSVFYCEKCQK
ncbi:MAG TPA: bifunctional DNA-formamidopyrimidine glycosylase/DNA-(apurinic or apyrimidinic site) lyase [Patescibacteria group bacterium]|nr:bifunctional DNA-formamidopyrimidine glycosylase/DNA-(apurinic or apyrimidinic site) lyase [Patescibacteria group bacterium]